ncbi:MAG: hypothetical protein L3K09_06125 [Thermoplasmata archaeon]|nr:hypothetical protein [Thermoplasmata archaeon]
MLRAISPEELQRLLAERPQELLLLDVREPRERAVARIEPSLHIPMNQVQGRIAELPRDREIVVYCHAGTRSGMVASFLERSGFPKVANLTGGIEDWSLRVDSSVPRY